MIKDYQPPSDPALASASGSEDALKKERQRGYANGYAAELKKIKKLDDEIAELRKLKVPPEAHDATVEYLISVSETFTGAARLLIEMRAGKNPQNNALSKSHEI